MKTITQERSEIFRNIAAAGDFVLLNGILLLSYVFILAGHSSAYGDFQLVTHLLLANLCYIPCLWAFPIILHQREARSEIIVARVVGTVVFHFILFLAVEAAMRVNYVPRSFIICFYTGLLVLLVMWRLAFRHALKRIRSRGRNARTVVLVGNGENIHELNEVMADPTYGYHVEEIFFNFGDEVDIHPKSENYLRELQRLRTYLNTHEVQELYCSLPSACGKDIVSIIHYCDNNLIRFFSVPNVRNYVKRKLQLTLLGDVPVLSIRKEPLNNPLNRATKRAFDLLVSGLFLITFYPWIWLIVGIIIKITSPGPIMFRQQRTGEKGRNFTMMKFRSMRVNADSDRVQASKDDPRKTKFGNFLRKTNIDELPQLWNVFCGDMSIVGPRPHMLKHTEEYSQLIDKYMMRHFVKPGLTGWAQVTGFRGETKELSQMEGRVKCDLWYIENWTFLLDIRIIVMTAINMLHGEENAF